MVGGNDGKNSKVAAPESNHPEAGEDFDCLGTRPGPKWTTWP
jgi:hypothetical protein